MEKRVKQAVIGTAIVVFIIIGVLLSILVKKLTPSKETMDLTEYYMVPEDEAMIIMDDAIYEKNALIIDNVVYLDFNTIIKYFNDRFYWDAKENLLIFTTPESIIKAETGNKSYLVNKTKETTDYVIVKTYGDEVYVAANFIKLYTGLNYQYYEEPNRVLIDYMYDDYLYRDVAKATQIRTEPSIKKPILKELSVGDKVLLIDNGGIQENGFLKVMTEDGIRGYVKKKHLGEAYYEAKENTFEPPIYSHITKEYTINLVWHQVTNKDANKNLTTMLASTKGLTTISPTWFRIDSEEGTISSLASEEYVTQAHNLGLEVWGLFDNFDTNVDSYKVLSKSSSRERLVNEIIAAAIKYNLDGINIDFEALSQETGIHFVQFLRELSVKCRMNHIVLSVDNYVPASYNKFYDLEEQGEVVDYVIIMGYDEHHSKSEEPGSVSSYNFFQNAISNSLEMVPANRLIMAVPFYTRLWKTSTEAENKILTSEALGMSNAESTIKSNGAAAEWDETTKQYYAEYQKQGSFYQIWMEEERSIEEKVKLIYDAKLTGVASWRLGYEKPAIWDVILKYVN